MSVLTTAPSRATRLILRTVLAIVLAGAAGCSVRLDTPPDPVPTPSGADAVRQQAAIAAAQIAELAGSVQSKRAEDIAADADAQVDALGGVWEPPARPGDPTTSPEPVTGTASDLLKALGASARAAEQSLVDPQVDAQLAGVLAAIVVNQDASARQLAAELETKNPVPKADPVLPSTLSKSAAGLIRTFDALGYAGEVAAARASGETSDRLAKEARTNRDQAEQLAILAEIDGTEADPREATYAVGNPDELDETMAKWRADLVAGWLTQIPAAKPEDRAAILAHARARAAASPSGAADPIPGT